MSDHKQATVWGGSIPGACGVECSCGTTYDGFDTIAEASELLDEHIRSSNERGEYVAGLRALADLLEQHPGLECPHTGRQSDLLVILTHKPGTHQREQIAAWARALPGEKTKEESYQPDKFELNGRIRGVRVCVLVNRAEVCERVVVGTREVVETVPDPELLAAVPIVEVTKTVEDVRWECKAILPGAGS